MTWLVYRQYRATLIWSVLFLALLIVALYALSADARHVADLLRAHSCSPYSSEPYCNSLIGEFEAHSNWSTGALVDVLYAAPGLLGTLYGVSIVAREFESETIGLVWLQSLSRRRWIWTKTAISSVSVIVVAGILGVAATVWSSSVYLRFLSESPLVSRIFDTSTIAMLGYSILAFGLGILAGSTLRRSGVAVAASLVVFAILRLLIEKMIRPVVEGSRFVALSVMPPYSPHNGLLVREGFLPLTQLQPHSGQPLFVTSTCQSAVRVFNSSANSVFTACLRSHGLHLVVQYIPNSQYWLAQGIEAVLCVAIAVAALVLSMFVVSRVDV
jgi:ABC-type transport system involved in multi-copper enzyme maturation permease subunit